MCVCMFVNSCELERISMSPCIYICVVLSIVAVKMMFWYLKGTSIGMCMRTTGQLDCEARECPQW